MNKSLLFSLLVLTFFATVSIVGASTSDTFDEIVRSYEVIRLTLLDDSIENVDEHALAISEEADESAKNESTAAEVRPLLPKIAGFAGQLAEADELEEARTAFFELSKMLVQYRGKVEGDDLPTVLYCPMAKRSWLQLEKEVGNPYHGQAMASCGNVVGQ